MTHLLIVDDDAAFRDGLAETLADLGHRVTGVPSGEKALALLHGAAERDAANAVSLVFLDLRMRGGIDGLETLRRLRAEPDTRELPVVMLTAHADSANTIEAMKLGAFDHLAKPVSRADIAALLARAPLGTVSPSGNALPANNLPSRDDRLIGSSPGMREVHKLIGLAAGSDATVLIAGETGTGKEEVARALHRHGPRMGKPFVAVNCAAIPAELLESELFGHVKGAFTGAINVREGRFREADGGTLFLDEIGDMTLSMQAKILRVLQERIVSPVGGSGALAVDVRVIAATHRDLIGAVREGAFREDLFYRLNVVRVSLPPLRERGSDILVLAEEFLQRMAAQGQAAKRFSPGAAQALLAHHWPGNVRELHNLMERVSVTVRGPTVERADLALDGAAASSPNQGGESMEALLSLPHAEAVQRLEKLLLVRALRLAGGNRAEAARRLGMHRQLLYAKIKEHGLEK